MDIDLLFVAIKTPDWSGISKEGRLTPAYFDNDKYVHTFEGKQAQEILNHKYKGEKELLLMVLDPLKIQSPIKHTKESDFSFVSVQGSISIDAIIDKIRLKSDNEGRFQINIKHFD